MSEVVKNPGERAENIRSGLRTIRHFYRIRPIPGIDLSSSHDAISFNDLFREFIADWRVLLTGIIAGLLAAILLISGAPPAYEASLSLAPAEASMSDPGGAASGAGAGGVLGLLGKSGTQYDDYTQFLDTTHSVRLAARLDAKYGLMKQVFPFDKKTGNFIPPPDIAARLVRIIRSTLGLPPWAPPNMVSLANFLKGEVETNSEADGTTTLLHYDRTPAEAGSFLTRVYVQTDDLMRQEKLASHRKRLEYLAQRLSDTSSLEQRNLLIGLWGREQSQMLLLTGGDPVGARMIDDIHVPNMPQNGAISKLLTGLISGLLAGLFVVIGRSAYRRA